MWLLAGLGNPGSEYARNRHNIGFMVLEELARRTSAPGFREKFGGALSQAAISDDKVVLLKPMEYMNLSGRAVARTTSFFQVDAAHLVVVHDDIDLEMGRLRLKLGGGHAGHNGVRSIIADLGTPDFIRVRCGVGRPGARMDVANYVLADFQKGEGEEAAILVNEAADAVEEIVKSGPTAAMNRYNKRIS